MNREAQVCVAAQGQRLETRQLDTPTTPLQSSFSTNSLFGLDVHLRCRCTVHVRPLASARHCDYQILVFPQYIFDAQCPSVCWSTAVSSYRKQGLIQMSCLRFILISLYFIFWGNYYAFFYCKILLPHCLADCLYCHSRNFHFLALSQQHHHNHVPC